MEDLDDLYTDKKELTDSTGLAKSICELAQYYSSGDGDPLTIGATFKLPKQVIVDTLVYDVNNANFSVHSESGMRANIRVFDTDRSYSEQIATYGYSASLFMSRHAGEVVHQAYANMYCPDAESANDIYNAIPKALHVPFRTYTTKNGRIAGPMMVPLYEVDPDVVQDL